MGIVLFGIALAIALFAFFSGFNKAQKRESSDGEASELTLKQQIEQENSDRKAAIEEAKICADIKAAVAKHDDAVNALQALARIDGTTTDNEKSVVFFFLTQQGEPLEQKHRDLFGSAQTGEWYRSADDASVDEIVNALRNTPLQYRVDVVASATAIVAGGGKPKKREAEMLNKLRALIAV